MSQYSAATSGSRGGEFPSSELFGINSFFVSSLDFSLTPDDKPHTSRVDIQKEVPELSSSLPLLGPNEQTNLHAAISRCYRDEGQLTPAKQQQIGVRRLGLRGGCCEYSCPPTPDCGSNICDTIDGKRRGDCDFNPLQAVLK